MTFKPSLARQARLKARSRPSLPGQNPMREGEWRFELIEHYQPQGPFEQLWIEDIAYRAATIEVIRAQIVGFRTRLLHTAPEDIARRAAYADEQRGKSPNDVTGPASNISPMEHAVLERWEDFGTTPMPLSNFLHDPLFAWSLGCAENREVYLLRQLQIHEHEEVRERELARRTADRSRGERRGSA